MQLNPTECLTSAVATHRHGLQAPTIRGMRCDWEGAERAVPSSHPMTPHLQAIRRALPQYPRPSSERDYVVRGAAASMEDLREKFLAEVEEHVQAIEKFLAALAKSR